MKITQENLESIKKFAKQFDEYHVIANKVFAVSNGHEYMDPDTFTKLREKEKLLRRNLNEEFGSHEQMIYNLLGGKPFLGWNGRRWDVFSEALSANFNIVKGESLNYVEDSLSKAVGAAKKLLQDTRNPGKVKSLDVESGAWFSDELLKTISDTKIRTLCVELNSVSTDNYNAAALLMRTILLLTLQKKLGKIAKDDLKDVLNQAISQDIYGDTHVKRILANLSSIPKTMLDASHHSKWVIIKKDELGVWLPGLVTVVEATFKPDV